MKKLYTLSFILLISLSFGQSLLYENFNYTVPGYIGGNLATATDAIGSNNWLTHSNSATTGTGTDDVLTGSLSYTGLLASAGNKVLLPGVNSTTPRDVNKTFTTATTATTIYYSFLINIIDNTQLAAGPIPPSTSSSSSYFISLGGTAGTSISSLFGRVAITSSNAGANYRISISNTSTGTLTYTENPVDLAFGTTHLVVVKYDISASPTVATLWVDPSSLGGSEPVSTLTNNSGTAAVTTFASIALRNSSATPKAEIDEIRVGETWASVTPANLSVNQNTIAGLNVYPNPVTNGNLHITSNSSEAKTVAVYDILGKQVLNAKTSNNTVNVANLKGGTYIVRITEDEKTDTRKLIIE